MDRKYMCPAFLLDAPLFWRPVDKFHFIINLDHMMKREEIWWRNLDKCLNISQKKYPYDWVLAVKCDLVLKSIFENAESNYPTNSYASVVRYCSNVYRYYNDNITPKVIF
ncbi:hypothetical protein ES332_D06G049200v1 [Gossypium tomentosum]|uniref:Uncharacterized protein n=2 Tax=Gossypium tomentosum TaxID=34277 RepID=A0A5D2KEX6_GOSTO|nr:hypothetical protein ES332_D06G049000v1 [Gossypium tomentosum]TYH65331.1 hypothetical protein ES332_D06G049100v1 [Gossypium tomentosum]TYH65332.1 hypothetical protein ES332_D06G049200v1 [Gossypium tomentosum]